MIISKCDVYSIRYGEFREFPVGRIKQDTLYLDRPSRHKDSKSYGIDVEVLQTKRMVYHYIAVLVKRDWWITSRLFWYHHGKKYHNGKAIELRNGRNEMFLKDSLFGADKAMKYERYMKHMETAQLSIFDVLQDKNPKALSLFESALKDQQEYEDSIKERKIDL